MKKISKNIVLIGMPGCGKTTIGRRLSKVLKIEFCDLDEYIVKTEKRNISDIFKEGEKVFREIEIKAVEEVSKKCPKVISTGGGVVKNFKNIDILRKNGVIIFIDRPIELIVKDINISKRPLLKDNVDNLYKIYDERYDLYKKCSDYRILNDMNIEHLVKHLSDNIYFIIR